MNRHINEEINATRMDGFHYRIEVVTFNFLNIVKAARTFMECFGYTFPDVEEFPKSYFLDQEKIPSLEQLSYDFIQELNQTIHEIAGYQILFLNYNHNLAYVLQNYSSASVTERNDLLRGMGVLFNTVFIGPKRILLDPTIKCNIDCYYCRTHSPAFRKNPDYINQVSSKPELDFDYIKENIPYFKELGVDEISVVGAGDPTVYHHFYELIELLAKSGFITNFSTNGLLLNPQKFEPILPYLKSGITVSVSSTTPDVYQIIHPSTNEKTFERLTSNLKEIISLRNKINNESVTFIFLFVITKDNYHQIPDVPDFAKSLGFDNVWFQLLHAGETSKEYLPSSDEGKMILDLVQKAKKRSEEIGLCFDSYIELQIQDYDEDSGTYSANSFDTYGCLVGWQFTYLKHEDFVSLCCGIKPITDLYSRNFKEHWFSDEYAYYRKKSREFDTSTVCADGTPLINDFCKSCDNINFQNEITEKVDKLLERTDNNYYAIYSKE